MDSMRRYKTKYTSLGVKAGIWIGVTICIVTFFFLPISPFSWGRTWRGPTYFVGLTLWAVFLGSVIGGFLGGILGALADRLTEKPEE